VQLKNKCHAYFTKLTTPAETQRVKELYAAGDHEGARMLMNEVIDRQDTNTKNTAKKLQAACIEIYTEKNTNRIRRDVNKQKIDYNKFFGWLSEEQRNEMKSMKESGAAWNVVGEKVWEYYEATDGEKRAEATESLKGACRLFIGYAIGTENAHLIKKMKTEGKTIDEISTKVSELIDEMTDTKKKEQARMVADKCKRIYEIAEDQTSVRFRRHDEAGHDLSPFDNYIKWLTDEQKQTLKTMKANGALLSEIQDKVFEFFKALPEARQTEVKNEFKDGCVQWIKDVASDDEQNEIRSLYDSGNKEAVATKVQALFDSLPDDKKHSVGHARSLCKKVWNMNARMRRHESHDSHTDDEEEEDENRLRRSNDNFIGNRKNARMRRHESHDSHTDDEEEEDENRLRRSNGNFISNRRNAVNSLISPPWGAIV
jgi:hypothetical protein